MGASKLTNNGVRNEGDGKTLEWRNRRTSETELYGSSNYMKGEKVMDRFKVMMMTGKRSRLLLSTAFAVAVTVFVSGIGVSYADPVSHDAMLQQRSEVLHRQVPAALKEKIAAKRAADAEHARAVRAEAVKQRKAQLEYSRNVLERQRNAPSPDMGGAK